MKFQVVLVLVLSYPDFLHSSIFLISPVIMYILIILLFSYLEIRRKIHTRSDLSKVLSELEIQRLHCQLCLLEMKAVALVYIKSYNYV
jgi:hypothetical protein